MLPANLRLEKEILDSGLSRKEWYGKIYLKSVHWKQLRIRKFKQSGRKCNRCLTTNTLQIHHNNYRNIFDVELFDLEVLCEKCHKKQHNKPHVNKIISVDHLKGKKKKRFKITNKEYKTRIAKRYGFTSWKQFKDNDHFNFRNESRIFQYKCQNNLPRIA